MSSTSYRKRLSAFIVTGERPLIKNISPRKKPADSRHCPCRQVLGNDLWQVSSDTAENHLRPTSESSLDGGLRKRIRMHIPTWVRIRARKEPYWSDPLYRIASTPAADRDKTFIFFFVTENIGHLLPASPAIKRDSTSTPQSSRLTVMPDGSFRQYHAFDYVDIPAETGLSGIDTSLDQVPLNSILSALSVKRTAVFGSERYV